MGNTSALGDILVDVGKEDVTQTYGYIDGDKAGECPCTEQIIIYRESCKLGWKIRFRKYPPPVCR